MSPDENSSDSTKLRDIQGLIAQSDGQLELMKKANDDNKKLLNLITESINGQGNSSQAYNWTTPAVPQAFETLDVKNFGYVHSSDANKLDSSRQSSSNSSENNIMVPLRSAKQTTYSPMLYVGDSIGHHVDFDFLQRESNCYITAFKAYSAENKPKSNFAEPPRFPDQNFEDVVKRELKASPARYLLMTGGSVDITNLRTSVSNPEKHAEDFRRIAERSARKMFQIAEDALRDNKFLEKVILMERTPRIDSKHDDPMGYKVMLTERANKTYWDQLEYSEFKDKIFIGKHRFNAQTRDIFCRTRDNRYDGIHLFGSKGRSSFTESVYGALQQANLMQTNPVTVLSAVQNGTPIADQYARNVNDHQSNTGYLVTKFDPNMEGPSTKQQLIEAAKPSTNNSSADSSLIKSTECDLKEAGTSSISLSSNKTACGRNIKIERNESLILHNSEIVTQKNRDDHVTTGEPKSTIENNLSIPDNNGNTADASLSRHPGLQIPGVKLEPESDVLVTNDIIKNDNWINPKKEAHSSAETDDMSAVSANVCLGNSAALTNSNMSESLKHGNSDRRISPQASEESQTNCAKSAGRESGEESLNDQSKKHHSNKVRQHFKGKIKKAKYSCKHCPLSTDNKLEFIQHKNTHKKLVTGNKYTCENINCTFSASKRKDLRKHDEEVHHKLKKIREKIGGNTFKLSKFMTKPASRHGTKLTGISSDESIAVHSLSKQTSAKDVVKASLDEKNSSTKSINNGIANFNEYEGTFGEQKATGTSCSSSEASTESDKHVRTYEAKPMLKANEDQQNNENSTNGVQHKDVMKLKTNKRVNMVPKANESGPSPNEDTHNKNQNDTMDSGNANYHSPSHNKRVMVEKVATVLQRRRSSDDGVEKIMSEEKESINRGIEFMSKIRRKFSGHPEKINAFHDLMRDYSQGNLDREQLLSNMTELFSSHNELIEGFKLFCGGMTRSN